MRMQQRASTYTCFSVWSTRTGIPHSRRVDKKTVLQFFKKQKTTIETVLLTTFLGSLLLGGIYLFLPQLAQYGW